MKVVLLLALLSGSGCDRRTVVGGTGGEVTLPCWYDTSKHGVTSACWGRGEIPSRGCSDQLIATDGRGVREDTRASSRYQLLGRLDGGDVSLTILNVTEGDAGRYGCRVEIPGWFNDDKHHFDLSVTRDPQTTTSAPPVTETPTEPAAANQTAGHTASAEPPPTSSFSSAEEGGSVTVVLVCVLFGVVFVVTAGGLVIIARRWRRLNKLPQQQQQGGGPVQFSSTSSTLQLHRRGSAVENIYQIDEGGDGGVYASCP